MRRAFVLGAGSAVPYGFPLGEKLKEIICTSLIPDSETYEVFRRKTGAGGLSEKRLAEFRESLSSSELPSIDRFLQLRPEYSSVGKLAIAFSLIQFEEEAALFNANEGHWYRHLYQRMGSTFDDWGADYSFVTFNYDRSLEVFLFRALKNAFGKTESEVATKLAEVPILHLYGDLGALPWQEGGEESQNPWNKLWPPARRVDSD